MVDANDRAEFLGQIIDVFEDFLTKKKAVPFNSGSQEDNDPNNPVYIFGDDYYEIENELAEIMNNWGIIKQRRQ